MLHTAAKMFVTLILSEFGRVPGWFLSTSEQRLGRVGTVKRWKHLIQVEMLWTCFCWLGQLFLLHREPTWLRFLDIKGSKWSYCCGHQEAVPCLSFLVFFFVIVKLHSWTTSALISSILLTLKIVFCINLCVDNMQPDKYLGCIYPYTMSAGVVIKMWNLGSKPSSSLQTRCP